ncbi:trypsin-like peptidase domain-containing protein [Rhizobium mesoamericanum]|uniref:Serine endoprotease, periplasmic n=1 Tax=Rhizobium mesoamericanum STM3625 TaxID=1211777 RepID=K0PV70_9HYPH|nr:trypsin-like peptidase domain-containing protein [Rhizobium mesoamericanum]CCM75375.1 serine endoprotease, periplasmic [Rhizobium mesoamericanum STM3625]
MAGGYFLCTLRSLTFAIGALGLTITSLETADAGQSVTPSLAPMLSRVIPTVVSISVRGKSSEDQDDTLYLTPGALNKSSPSETAVGQISETTGTGVITDARNGYILTNNHVIEGATSIKVTIASGESFDAAAVGADAQTDLAVIRIRASGLSQAMLGDSGSLNVGDYVVAIGTPYGLGKSATFGIVSALDRSGLGLDSEEGFIQTDASLNPGNSGGALVDLEGKVVGINTAILGPSGANIGIGFAVPINTASAIMRQLVAHGEIRRGQLGVQVQDSGTDFAKALGVSASTGALVNEVRPQSPGAKAGIIIGDVIAAVDGVPVSGSTQLRARISALPPETPVKLTLLRRSGSVEVVATLAAAAATEPPVETVDYVDGKGLLDLVTLQTLDAASDAFGKVQGAVISSISDNSLAAAAGLRPGDVITSVNQTNATTPQMVAELSKASTDLLLLGVFRDGHRSFLVVKR